MMQIIVRYGLCPEQDYFNNKTAEDFFRRLQYHYPPDESLSG